MFDLGNFLIAIRDDAPAGDDLRERSDDLALRRIAEQRRELEPELDPLGAGKPADWAAVAGECEALLRTRSKDLEVAAWLAEAWARQRGFPGLRDGLQLVAALCDSFWEGLHPGCAGGQVDLEVRARPLRWLGSSRSFLRSVDRCEIVAAESGGPLCWEEHRLAERAEARARVAERDLSEERVEPSAERWSALLRAAGPAALAAAHGAIASCESARAELERVAARCFGAQRELVDLQPLGERLREIREHLERCGTPPGSELPLPAAASAARPLAPIQSRELALQMLVQVAAYFRRSEPHSPIAALVSRAVHWGALPFEQLLPDLVRDEGVLAEAWKMLGVRPNGSSS